MSIVPFLLAFVQKIIAVSWEFAYTLLPSVRYQTALRLFEELEMPYLAPIHALDTDLDYDLPGDSHWNSDGHQKVGAMLSDCLAAFEISGDWSACEEVVMP